MVRPIIARKSHDHTISANTATDPGAPQTLATSGQRLDGLDSDRPPVASTQPSPTDLRLLHVHRGSRHELRAAKGQRLRSGKDSVERRSLATPPGSEFRPVSLLQPIFEAHPFWQRMQSSLLVGATMELAPLSETDRTTLIATALTYGNHKSATKNAAELLTMLRKEVSKGWHLPLPINWLHENPRTRPWTTGAGRADHNR